MWFERSSSRVAGKGICLGRARTLIGVGLSSNSCCMIMQQELDDNPTPIRVLALPKQMPLPATLDEDLSNHISPDKYYTSTEIEPAPLQSGTRSRAGVLALLILLMMSGVAGIMLISRQYSIFSEFTKHMMFLNNS